MPGGPHSTGGKGSGRAGGLGGRKPILPGDDNTTNLNNIACWTQRPQHLVSFDGSDARHFINALHGAESGDAESKRGAPHTMKDFGASVAEEVITSPESSYFRSSLEWPRSVGRRAKAGMDEISPSTRRGERVSVRKNMSTQYMGCGAHKATNESNLFKQ